MNPLKLHVAYREALAAFEGLRKLGFRSDDIYFSVGAQLSEGWQVAIVLLTQDKRFNIVTGLVDDDPSRIQDTWMRVATAISEGRVKQSRLNRIWRESMVYGSRQDFVASLLAKGFTLPKAAQHLN